MALRGTGRGLLVATGVAGGTAAAQLGLAYGLDIVSWVPPVDGPDADWAASLVWAVWVAATSAVVGAICAGRLTGTFAPADSGSHDASTLRRTGIAVAAGLGALVAVALVAVPARTASSDGTAAGYAAIGVAVGLVAAFWALSSRPAAVNLVATISWLWLLGVASVINGILTGRDTAIAPLGAWQFTDDSRFWFRDYLHWPSAAASLGAALLIGGMAVRISAPRAGVGAAVSGAAGPLLVAAAYLIAASGPADSRVEQFSAQLTSAYAVAVGVAGSGLVAALVQLAHARRAPSSPADDALAAEAAVPGLVPTEAPVPADAAPVENGAASDTAGTASTVGPAEAAVEPVVLPNQPSGPPSMPAERPKRRRTGKKAASRTADDEEATST